jgi:hypothetical protein
MATLSELQEEWKIDCNIDGNHLDDASLRTPHLHSKYISYLTETRLKLSKTKSDYNKLRKLKFRYYRGELSKEECVDLNWRQYQGCKPLKTEMNELLNGDEHITEMDLKIEYLGTMIALLESILWSIKDRTWSIRSAVDYKKFLAGG